jgi:hypothetical protein
MIGNMKSGITAAGGAYPVPSVVSSLTSYTVSTFATWQPVDDVNLAFGAAPAVADYVTPGADLKFLVGIACIVSWTDISTGSANIAFGINGAPAPNTYTVPFPLQWSIDGDSATTPGTVSLFTTFLIFQTLDSSHPGVVAGGNSFQVMAQGSATGGDDPLINLTGVSMWVLAV